MRRRLWPDRLGFAPRRLPSAEVTLPASTLEGPDRAYAFLPAGSPPRVDRVGVAGGLASTVAAGARLAGLDVAGGEEGQAGALAGRAAREAWPLLALPAAQLGDVSPSALRAFLCTGGMLVVTGLEPGANPALQALEVELGTSLPVCRWLSEGRRRGVIFSERERLLTRELAGARFESDEARAWLVAPDTGTLAWTEEDGNRAPLAWTAPVAGGRIVLTTGASDLEERGEGKWRYPLAVLVPLMALGAAFGETAWHAPWTLANVTVDDPTLDQGLLGLDYRHIVELARAHGFHLTVATIPRELGLADPAVLELLRRERDVVGACYHGNDHDSYEFYIEGVARHRFPARPLATQRRKLTEAASRGTRLATSAGFALDRVMVFPHGVCSAELLPSVHDAGFLATCNGVDRYPLGSVGPPSEETGTRPADLDWSGFPLLGRRPLGAVGELALDLFLGKPAIGFTHRPDMEPRFTPVLEHAAAINRLGGSAVRWCGLEDLARHAYLVRRVPEESRWEVLMTANEICLHNSSPSTRVYRVRRPCLPATDRLEVRSPGHVLRTARAEVDVTVPPERTVDVTVVRPGGSGLPRPWRGACLLGC